MSETIRAHEPDPAESPPPRRGRRVVLLLEVLAVLALAAWGHYLFWYAPRIRPATPASGAAARLFALASQSQESVGSALWVAHPHQNLPALGEILGLAGPEADPLLDSLDLPRASELPLPPARALTVAQHADDERTWLVVVDFHPLAAAFVRLAGALAGNPWMAGGSIDLDEITVETAWDRATWTASSGDVPATWLERPGPRLDLDQAVAWARLDARGASLTGSTLGGAPVAEGLYRLTADETAVGWQSLAADPAIDESAVAGLAVHRAAESILTVMSTTEVEQALFLLPLPAGTSPDELPRASMLFRAPATESAGATSLQRWDLPAESLLDAAGRDLPKGAVAGWDAAATDALGLGQAIAAGPALRDLRAAEGLPAWALWADAEPAATEMERLAAGLDGALLIEPEEEERARAAATLLRLLAGRVDRVEALRVGDAVRARLVLRAEP